MIENKQEKSVTPPIQTEKRRPNETGSISVEGHIRIFDPKNKEIFVETRA